MPIAMCSNGQNVKVIKMLIDEKTKKHLEDLGITIGSLVQVVSSDGGNIIIEAKGTRLALSKNVALKILVAQERQVQFMLKKLDQMKVGETGRITKVNGEGKLRRRLFDMGVTPGASIYLRKVAPLGDPIEVTIRGYELSLRKVEAELVDIEVEEK